MALVWLQFGYSSGVWTKQCLLAMPLVVRGWAASHFGIETTQEDEYQKCKSQSLICLSGTGRWGLWLVTTCQVFDSVTPPRHLQMIDSSAGRSSAQEWQGSGVRGRREQGHIGTWKDQQQYLSEAPHFKAREGLHILTFFFLFLFFFSEVLVLSLSKSPSEVSIHNEVTF